MCYKGYNLFTRLLVYSFTCLLVYLSTRLLKIIDWTPITKNSTEAPLVRGETEDIYESY